MSMRVRFTGHAIAAATLAIALTVMSFASSARADERVLSNTDVQARTGKSIADWGAQWWQWAFSNPDVLVDKTGKPDRSATRRRTCSLWKRPADTR